MKTEIIHIGVYAHPSEYSSDGYCITINRIFDDCPTLNESADRIMLADTVITVEINEDKLTGELIDMVVTNAAREKTEELTRIEVTKDRILEKLRTLPAPE